MPDKNPMAGLLPMTEDFAIDIPDTVPDDTDEKRKKTISKSKQWKDFLAFARQRQELFRKQTPGGINYNSMTKEDAAFYGAVGNAVMDEYELLINFMEGQNG